MAKWKLTRQIYGDEEFEITEGQKVTVGRALDNIIAISSAVISRNHCMINVQNNEALITDLKSSNGVYVGTVRIPPNAPYVIKDSDIIGLGWAVDVPLVNIKDTEKYVFKFTKKKNKKSLTSRIQFQSDNDFDDIEEKIAKISGNSSLNHDVKPVFTTKFSLKRKSDADKILALSVGGDEVDNKNCIINDVINIVTDSDSDPHLHSVKAVVSSKKPKLETVCEEGQAQKLKDVNTKTENENLEYEAFNVKQEHYDEEPITIDNESDSESEHWLLRLSQSSPGKPFIKAAKSPKSPKVEIRPEDSSYSQMDDFFEDNNFNDAEEEEFFEEDMITFPPPPDDEVMEILDKSEPPKLLDKSEPPKLLDKSEPPKLPELPTLNHEIDDIDRFSDDIISIIQPPKSLLPIDDKDEVDGFAPPSVLLSPDNLNKQVPQQDLLKKTQMIEPIAKLPKSRSNKSAESKPKSSSSKQTRYEKSSSKKSISHSQKEERKKKLRELASKDKDKPNQDNTNSSKPTLNVKVKDSSSRGAFLSDVAQAVVKPVKRKENANKSKDKHTETSPKSKSNNTEIIEDIENKKKEASKSKRDKSKDSESKKETSKINGQKTKCSEIERVPLKSLKPLTDSEDTISGKPCSKVEPVQKKRVRFSEVAPQVREFEIEPGHKMKKTSSLKHSVIDYRRPPVFSLEKITLMKILRWNPQWLEEQINNKEPPPILGHNNTPLTVFHSFVNHSQYVQLIGDLLLMEIWECLSIAYNKIRNQQNCIQMRIESLPPIPTQERMFDLFSISVNISVPSANRNVPRAGEILNVTFGPDNSNQRFFYVNNVRCLPSPPSNKNSFYSISLHATYTDKMASLRPGELMVGRPLSYINNELTLFEAMEYLAGSPLSDAILKPEPHHFLKYDQSNTFTLHSQWTSFLNPNQLEAVSSSVSAALGDRPSLQMIQGPPGTGKSSVICAIVMTYFYDAQGKKQQNRGKLLICATSNAAVDGLVVRLLKLRQSLPKQERFRMVRVGRAEAMHPLAANVSSQQLATRELARHDHAPATNTHGLLQEISHIEAKINMWKTAALDAKDPVRVAFCQGKAAEGIKRITLLRSRGGGGGGAVEARPEQVLCEEKRIIEGADLVLTTLASAHQYKMKGLKRRIALCIIDEAGQVIEPETLIPLTLDVTKLTLIGDPQQLPGFICSQRAKQHGLNESLFSRLSSVSEQWSKNPLVLLTQQYRMHPDIADYPSRAFYDNKITSIPPLRPSLKIPPYCIVSVSSGDKGQGVSGANETEACGVARLAAALASLLRPRHTLAVITPYSAHKELIKKYLKHLHTQGEEPVEVNTVDSFQGQERDVVVVSLARSHGVGFLTDAGRMNVMLTRARHALLVVLNPAALLKNHQWRTLVEDSQKRNMFKVLPNKMCLPITAPQVPNDDILKYIVDDKSHR